MRQERTRFAHLGATPTRVTAAPIAHLREDGTPHLLDEHLREVGALAAAFAALFGASDWARLAGLWHDLGKYSLAFQRRIREENGVEAHVEPLDGAETLRDHSTAGALLAQQQLGANGWPIAFVIAGHHAGLADRAQLSERLAKRAALLSDALRGGAPEVLTSLPPPALLDVHKLRDDDGRRRLELWIRLLFSALCDGDFLDTERFYDADRSAARERRVTVAELRSALEAHVTTLERGAVERGATEVDRVRSEVRAACATSASMPPGFFSLTVPTGGGKTLASMSFALSHAEAHGLSRVVVAVPYTAIIEQNSDAYRAAFGALADEAMIEHYSSLDPQRETWRNRLSSENWDAPVVVTTTVQLFESLFASRTSRCRKLHNLARAVIVLDEAQTLPVALLNTIIDGLRSLVGDYGATVVFCTATQPAFRREDSRSAKPEPWRVEGMREIVPAEVRAFDRLRRVTVRWPRPSTVTPYEALADELAALDDALAIVHLRADARTLTELLDERLGDRSTLHLSALMTPSHRARVMADLMARRRRGERVRLVATQLVEAGVNLDFPVVYRAMGGVDAMAQAAGRCNREGRMTTLGELRVFIAETQPPKGVARRSLEVTKALLGADGSVDLFAPLTYRRFFTSLYRVSETDAKRVQEERAKFNFGEVGKRFQMIEDDWSAPVVIPEPEAREALEELRRDGPSRRVFRRLQRHTVNAPKTVVEAWLRGGQCELLGESVTVLRDLHFERGYTERFGLDVEAVSGAVIDPELLIA